MVDDKLNLVGKNISEKATLIWNVADVLRGPFKEHEYGKVILPMMVIKRFHDCLLPTHDKVLATFENCKTLEVKEGFLRKASGYQFYNISKFTFETLLADEANIEDNFNDYLSGFSDNVQDVIAKFKFADTVKNMVETDTLYLVIDEFNKEKGYLGPDKISSVDCGYIFEELVRRFSEAIGDGAGEHFTSRDIIYLMSDLLLCGREINEHSNITVYDMTMGTSQMLGCMEERIHELNREAMVTVFGQEVNPDTFAIAKSDMLIRGGEPDNMRYGDTLSDDQFNGYTFDFCISNPPFGIDWKKEKKEVEDEYKKGILGRFSPGLPKISDGQQLFLLNGLSKLAQNGKMAIIQNGSPLFSGDAGSGPSEIRKYILADNDWLECIIQLSTDQFMNTGISTYIWVLNKDKPVERAGRVQLIDASHCFEQRRKSIGSKRNDITDRCRDLIVWAYEEFAQNKVYGDVNGIYCESKIFDGEEFGYSKITVERPLRWRVAVNDNTINKFIEHCKYSHVEFQDEFAYLTPADDVLVLTLQEAVLSDKFMDIRKFKPPRSWGQMEADRALTVFLRILMKMKKDEPYLDYNAFVKSFNFDPLAKTAKIKFEEFEKLNFFYIFREIDPKAEIVLKKGKPIPDSNLRDTENVPLREDIDEYFRREVLPYAPDAWIDRTKTKIGYEIPMTRYFYKYQPPEKSEDILARIQELERGIAESLSKVTGE